MNKTIKLMKTCMKRILTLLVLAVITLAATAQGNDAFEQLKANPKKAYGTDCPYPFDGRVISRSTLVITDVTVRATTGILIFTGNSTRCLPQRTNAIN